jgi:hypothetical protein
MSYSTTNSLIVQRIEFNYLSNTYLRANDIVYY